MQAVTRAMSVLEYLASRPDPCGPSEISRSLDLSKPSVLRLLRTWQSLGYVERIDGLYEVGWKILVLANARSESQELHRAARRHLAWLNEQSGETVHLAVLRDMQIIYLDKIEGSRSIRVHGDIGRGGPSYATASGKAILANLSGTAVDKAIGRPIRAWTPVTITNMALLQRELADTRERGYSINRGEWHEQIGGVGAAVFGRDGSVVGGLSILFPMSEAEPSRVTTLGELVRTASERLSIERGWAGSLKLDVSGGDDGSLGTLQEGARIAAGDGAVAERPAEGPTRYRSSPAW